MNRSSFFYKGISILEVVVAAAILLILTTSIAGAWQSYIKLTRISNERTQAALLLEEAADGLRFLRDNGWAANINSQSTNTAFGISWNGTSYQFDTTPQLINNLYNRTVTFSRVSRDVQDNISSSGTDDAKTRKVSILVSTNQTPPEVSIQTEMLLHDVHKN